MPHTILIDPGLRLAQITMGGQVGGAEFIEAARELYARPDLRSGYNQLWDARDVLAFMLVPQDVEAFVRLAEEFRAQGFELRGKRALVLRQPMQDPHIEQFLKEKLEPLGPTLKVFEQIEEARAWLLEGTDAPPQEAE